jgi:RNA polymerase sigma-70 factor (sigma-E family)
VRRTVERQYTEYVTARIPVLRRTALLLCGDSHRADDLVQTAITRLYVHWRKASEAQDLDAYVRKILVRTFLNDQRRGWFQRERVTAEPVDRPAPAADPDAKAVLHAALATVPARQRAALVLRFLCDLPVAEVAAQLGCAEGTVKSLTSDGLKSLRRKLGGREAMISGVA